MTPRGQWIRYIQRAAAAGVAAAGLAGPAAAQSSEALERAKLLRAIADQKAESDVVEALQTADGLARVSAVQAVERLKQAQLALDLAVGISSEKRKELTHKLQARIAALEGKAPVAAPALDPKATEVKNDARQAVQAAAAEAQEVAEGLAKAALYLDRGQPDDARRIVAELSRKYPNNPSLHISQKQDEFATQIRAERELSRQAAQAWTENMRDIARSAIPATGDIQFPSKAKWDELTKRRQQPAVQLTPKEEAILESLNKQVGVIFRDRPFEESLQELSNQLGEEIFIDKKSLEDLGLDMSRPVSFQGKVSGRTALRAILQTNGLTFVVKDEMIQVMTLEKAQQTLITRSYYLGDLIAGTGPFGNAVQWGPFISYQQTLQNAQMVVEAITSSVDPMAWNTSRTNGPCTISFHLPTMSITVRASAEVHASLGNTLTGKK
jgi:hypothetical protein